MYNNYMDRPSSKKPSPNNKLGNFLLGSMVVGGLFAILLMVLGNSGLFEKWSLLTRVPENTATLINGVQETIYVQLSDGKVLSCSEQNNNECWIPNVNPDSPYSKPCDPQNIAFSLLDNPPKDPTSCIMVETPYAEATYKDIYIIDHGGNLWKWEQISSGLDVLLYPFICIAGGLGGMLIGSIGWAINSKVQKRRTPSETNRFSNSQIALLAAPWLCLISIFLLSFFLQHQSNIPAAPSTPNIYTAVAETVTIKIAELSQKWLDEAKPGTDNLRYDFSQIICDATWTSSRAPVTCSEDPHSPDLMVSRIIDPSLEGNQMKGKGVWIQMDPIYDEITGEYPTMRIQDGDHFKMTAGCLDEASDCNIVFELSYETPDSHTTLLGKWSQRNDGKIEEIDLDLSKLAGQKVRFHLTSSDFNNKKNFQNAVWFMPRIEK